VDPKSSNTPPLSPLFRARHVPKDVAECDRILRARHRNALRVSDLRRIASEQNDERS
jgi:hypothetical protein